MVMGLLISVTLSSRQHCTTELKTTRDYEKLIKMCFTFEATLIPYYKCHITCSWSTQLVITGSCWHGDLSPKLYLMLILVCSSDRFLLQWTKHAKVADHTYALLNCSATCFGLRGHLQNTAQMLSPWRRRRTGNTWHNSEIKRTCGRQLLCSLWVVLITNTGSTW
jgi:hypothetical protein